MLRSHRGLTEAGIEHLPERRAQTRPASIRLSGCAARPFALSSATSRKTTTAASQVRRSLTALRELDGLRLRTRGRAVAGMPSGGPFRLRTLRSRRRPAAGLASRRWQSLGPGNIGGRTRSILIHPTTPRHDVAASVGRRNLAHRQRRTGLDASRRLYGEPCGHLDRDGSVRFQTSSMPETGEGIGNLDACAGGGIVRTTDADNWAHVPPTAVPVGTESIDLAISADGTILLAATNAGIRRSTDPARAIWQTVLSDQVADVKFHPANPNRA